MIYFLHNSLGWSEIEQADENSFHQWKEPYATALEFCRKWLRGQQQFVFHTSGSTGKPKAIEVSREQMLWSAQNTIDALHLTSTEHILLCINPRMIGGAMMLVRAMMLGCRITVINSSSKILHQLPSDHSYTFASFVPLQLAVLMEESTDELLKKLNRFRHILIGGAPLSKGLNDALQQSSCNIWHTYGMTETISHIALRNVKDTAYHTLPATRIKLDNRGCLCICNVATQSQWLTTNDMATMIDEQHFTIIGRADEVVNSGGLKFNIREIEQLLEQLAPQLSFFVAALPDERLGEKIIAVFEGSLPDEQLLQSWKNEIESSLSAYAIPKQVFTAERFARTPSGKINKQLTIDNLLL